MSNVVYAWKFGAPKAKYSNGKLVVTEVPYTRIALNMDDPSNPVRKEGIAALLPPAPNSAFVEYPNITKSNFESWVAAAINKDDPNALTAIDEELKTQVTAVPEPTVALPFEDADPELEALTNPEPSPGE